MLTTCFMLVQKRQIGEVNWLRVEERRTNNELTKQKSETDCSERKKKHTQLKKMQSFEVTQCIVRDNALLIIY